METPSDLELSLLDAARSGDYKETLRLLKAGIDPDTREHETNTTVLGLAAFGGHRDLCRLLLQYGADWDTSPKTVGGETAVDDAVRGGHKSLAEYLRYRLGLDQTMQAAAEAEAKRQPQEEVLTRKAKYTQLQQE